jgi:GNAT superfamily N-acetyltransferase
MADVIISNANLDLPQHQVAVIELMNAYASDPMGDGKPLSDEVKGRLIDGLRRHPTTLIILAFEGDRPVGIATCFFGFSTFAARPLLNMHDYFVLPEQRGSGVGGKLLSAVEAEARKKGCCKLTLEVQENNHRARAIYEAFGFNRATYVEAAGGSLAMSKPLG